MKKFDYYSELLSAVVLRPHNGPDGAEAHEESAQVPARQTVLGVFAEAPSAEMPASDGAELHVSLRNDLPHAVRFHGPAACRLVDVYRDGEYLLVDDALGCDREACDGRDEQMSIAPGQVVTVRVALRDWKVDGGWTAGSYRVRLRIDGVTVDDYSTVGVMSAPCQFALV